MALTKVTYSMIKGSTYSVVDYGADPTGATDSTNAFIACSQEVQANGGGRVVFPKGTYLIYKQGVSYANYPFEFDSLSGIVVDFSEATIKVDPAKDWTGQNASLFRFTDCNDIYVLSRCAATAVE